MTECDLGHGRDQHRTSDHHASVERGCSEAAEHQPEDFVELHGAEGKATSRAYRADVEVLGRGPGGVCR